ncbi:MAG TPA: hypothetical protein VFG79_19670, partial [Solirubrobacter sp.]|nr:hypothetical protein [Solirubrobacter sp.]
IDAQVRASRSLRLVQVRSDGDTRTITAPAGPRGAALTPDASAPGRIVRTATRRAKLRPADVSYLVLTGAVGKPRWELFFADGTHFSANARGTRVRRVGG